MKLSFSQLFFLLAGTVCLLSYNNSYAQSLSPGTAGNTIYDDETQWISSSNLYHDGTNVGIGGVNNPLGKLHIISSSESSLFLERSGSGWNNTKVKIGVESFFYPPSAWPGLSFQMSDDGGTNYTNALFIRNDGYIGIGTFSPSAKLHITTNSESGIFLEREGTTWENAKFKIGIDENGGPIGMRFGILQGLNYSDAFFIANNGKIGVRTAIPEGDFHIKSQGESGIYLERENTPWDQTKIKLGISGNGGPAGLRFQISPDNWTTEYDNALFIGNNGKIGVGTVIPQGQHHIETDASDKALYFSNRVSGTVNPVAAYMKLAKPTNSNDANRLSFYTTNDGGTNSREALTLHKNGHVSVNFHGNTITASNPSYEAYNELEVWGQATVFGQLNIKNSNNTIEAKITSSGVMTLREVNVNVDMIPPDYVFQEEYKLMSLDDLKSFVKANNHLPGVPPASEMENGVNVGEMQFKLLEKVEELTLYTLQLKEEIDLLKAQNELLKEQLK